MSVNLLIYADCEYYHLVSIIDLPLRITNLNDKFNKLRNIVPKSIYSVDYFHYIVDTNSNIHYIVLSKKLDDLELYSNVGKTLLKNFEILGYDAYNGVPRGLLLQDLDDDTLCEYIIFNNLCATQIVNEIIPNSRITSSNNLRLTTKNGRHIVFIGKQVKKRFSDFNDNKITYNKYSISGDENTVSAYKHYTRVYMPSKYYGVDPTFLFLVGKDNNCYVSGGHESKMVTKLTTNSLVIYDDNNIVIVTDNNISIVTMTCKIFQCTLSVEHIYNIANTKLSDLVWSKQLYAKLFDDCKPIIRTFMLCNRLMGYLKIPHCVLSIIFNGVTNKN